MLQGSMLCDSSLVYLRQDLYQVFSSVEWPFSSIINTIVASVFILGQYYPRYEMQWRLGMLMVGNALGTAIAGLLAFAIAGIKSGNGYHGWRWIFIVSYEIS